MAGPDQDVLRGRHAGRCTRLRRTLGASALVAVAMVTGLGAEAAAAAGPARTVLSARTVSSARTMSARTTGKRAPVTPPTLDPSPSYEVSPSGAVWALGGAPSFGQLVAAKKHSTVQAVTMTGDDGGYWLVTAVGGVYGFGDAGWYGSPRHSGQIFAAAGLVADPTGAGYWVYGQGGQVDAYGAAPYVGGLSFRSIVDMVATPDGQGYWLVDADGTVSAFGTAATYGAAVSRPATDPVVAMAATADGRGYWLVDATGAVFNEGDAAFEGSLTGQPIDQPIASVLPTSDDLGYWLVAHDGDLYPFGDAVTSTPPVTAFRHTILTAGDEAVEWAMAQLGKPYQWGGTGPASFDCSGLTMEAWEAAGVAIPRIAADQYIHDPHVALTALVNGDLVFYASSAKPTSIYHVAMYLGGGRMVNAPYTGQVVRTEWVYGTQLVAKGAAP
jgi:cell wall-associated NlpC family hydrolase